MKHTQEFHINEDAVSVLFVNLFLLQDDLTLIDSRFQMMKFFPMGISPMISILVANFKISSPLRHQQVCEQCEH